MLSLYVDREERHILKLLMQMTKDSKAQTMVALQIHVIPSGSCFQISSMRREITVSLLLSSAVEMVQMR
jgi:hypothetical protein